ncbi:hypothetical protein [Rummeliibacillus stabekisii]|uniref:Uncharacterized protein n=1 Tax=Rummeliibacillus stabekisii TaxID=241244 RepID=A0A143HF97_9BACL|nr:hypothetical protein [Rummeliibacillus stabekisii]AMX00418.1 hypothetical protein ATY39_13955 [Rummeliibacillus stabekisii]
MMFNFDRLIAKYSSTFTAKITTEGYYDDGGKYHKGETKDIPYTGAVMPMTAKSVYASGGKYTTSDAKLYIKTRLKEGTKITYDNHLYTVQDEKSYERFGGFFYYVLKAVDSFA